MNNILIPNKKYLERLKQKISRGGASKLHVLTDFDRTLTKLFVDGKEVPSLISVLRDEHYLTPDYPAKAHALFDKYHPIEIDPKISLKRKKEAMQEWWTLHFKQLIESKLHKKDIEKAVGSSRIRLRDGVLEFIDMLHEHDIPLIIMSSSGLGYEAIETLLENQGRMYKNVYIISNAFIWDKNGNAIGIKKPVITSMSKDETMVKDYPQVFKVVKNRRNVLLLGDTAEDIDMITGFDYDNIIKVGFLNKNIQENLARYKKAYDLIILNDSDKFYVDRLLKELIKKG
jgi:5'-nucleotidase